MDGEVRGNRDRASLPAADFLITSALVASCAFIAWIILAH
jgi:hypothetical protein